MKIPKENLKITVHIIFFKIPQNFMKIGPFIPVVLVHLNVSFKVWDILMKFSEHVYKYLIILNGNGQSLFILSQ